MSLKISNKATDKQLRILAELEYYGTGKYAATNLTVQEATKIIDELFIERKYTYGEIAGIAADYYDFPIQNNSVSSQEEYEDPFNNVNKRNK